MTQFRPPGPGPDDGALIGRDPDAFEAFYRAHVRDVERFIARRTADPQVAADLTADVFVTVIERAHTFDPARGSQLAWLYGIARNVVAQQTRKQARHLRATSRVVGRALLDSDSLARVEERIDAEAGLRRVFEAMAGLPDGDRAVLELVAVDGLSLDDAASALGVKPGTARVRLHRARRRLASALTEADRPITTFTFAAEEARP